MFDRSPGSSWVSSAALGISCAALAACTSDLRPVSPEAKLGDRPAAQVVLALEAPCTLSPAGPPRGGRPDGPGPGEHTLPAGRYAPSFEDDDGIFFASPNGVVMEEPLPLGTRARAGGIYVPREASNAAQEYVGDADRVTERYRLPERCRYSFENAAAPAPPG